MKSINNQYVSNYPESERPIREKLASVLQFKEGSSFERVERCGLGLARWSFVYGYQKSLLAGMEDIPSMFDDATPQEIGFMLEGAGMALTLVDAMNNSSVKYVPTLFEGRPDSELKLCAIGVGWASARMGKPVHWRPEGIF